MLGKGLLEGRFVVELEVLGEPGHLPAGLGAVVLGLGRGRDGGHGPAVERAVRRQDDRVLQPALLHGVLQTQLNSRLVGLAAAVAEEGLVQARGVLHEPGRELALVGDICEGIGR